MKYREAGEREETDHVEMDANILSHNSRGKKCNVIPFELTKDCVYKTRQL